MPAANYNFYIEQGSAYKLTFLYTDQNGSPVDIRDYCVLMQWLTNTGDAYIFSNKYTGDDYDFQSYANGSIVLQLPARTTNTYTFDSFVYDLDLQEPTEQYPGGGLTTYRLSTGTVGIIKRNIPTSLPDCANVSSSVNNLAKSCDNECNSLDIYSVIYDGNSLTIPDNNVIIDTINISDTRLIDNIEVAINGLNHNSPQDLIFILSPPLGDKILLSANSKILNYKSGFSFMFSNRASNGSYISNVVSGGLCNIVDKTSVITYNEELLVSNIDGLVGSSAVGDWELIVIDNDPGVSGTISSWKLIITYQP
jgi:subtilisin-like proprotein convertase family protein